MKSILIHSNISNEKIHMKSQKKIHISSLSQFIITRCSRISQKKIPEWPICSMYSIFTYIWVIYGVNVGKYSIHGAYGWYNGSSPRCQSTANDSPRSGRSAPREHSPEPPAPLAAPVIGSMAWGTMGNHGEPWGIPEFWVLKQETYMENGT